MVRATLVGLIVAAAALLAGPGAAEDAPAISNEPMKFELSFASPQFRLTAPSAAAGLLGSSILSTAREIIANGSIVGDGELPGVPSTSSTLEKWLNDNHIPSGTLLVLQSYGGNLGDGMATAEVVRKYGLSTSVAEGSMCASACNFVFMGGIVRTIPKSAQFVVHRFVPADPSKLTVEGAVEDAEQGSGVIEAFLHEMGVSSKFLITMSQIENKKPRPLSADELQSLRIVSPGGQTRWRLETLSGHSSSTPR